jgi:hypothetical protein
MGLSMSYSELIDLMRKNPAIRIRKEDMEQLEGLEESKKEHKFHAKPGYLDGIYFDSQAEMERYGELNMLILAKVISSFKVHPRYRVSENHSYEADFEVIYPDGHIEVEDVKGFETPEFKLKADLFRAKYPELILKIVK